MPDRRGFLGAVAALVAAPWLPKPLSDELRGCTFAEWEQALSFNPPPLCNAIITDLKDPYIDEEDPDELDWS